MKNLDFKKTYDLKHLTKEQYHILLNNLSLLESQWKKVPYKHFLNHRSLRFGLSGRWHLSDIPPTHCISELFLYEKQEVMKNLDRNQTYSVKAPTDSTRDWYDPQDLDKDCCYDLRDITEGQADTLYIWLKENDPDWSLTYNSLMEKDFPKFRYNGSGWEQTRASNEVLGRCTPIGDLFKHWVDCKPTPGPLIKELSIIDTEENLHGSLYLIAEQRGWNAYQFDIVNRIERAVKKGNLKEDLQKTKDLIDLWIIENENK